MLLASQIRLMSALGQKQTSDRRLLMSALIVCLVKVYGEATNGKGNRSNHGVPLVVMFAEAGRAADLSRSYTFKQSDGSEYTTTFVI